MPEMIDPGDFLPRYYQLANILRMADMVKFAKWTPLPVENEQLLAGAIKLVQQTTMQDEPARDHA